jgi:hypothetical protein
VKGINYEGNNYVIISVVLSNLFSGAPNTQHVLRSRDQVVHTYPLKYKEELHNLYSSPSIITMIKSRRMKWTGHVARMGAKRKAYRILVNTVMNLRIA